MKKKIYSHFLMLSLILLFCGKSAYSQVTVTADSVSCGSTGTTLHASLLGDIPTDAGITEDDVYTASAISLGFEFKFYGNYYDKCLIGSNGVICFDLSLAGAYNPWPISAVLHGNSSAYNSICGPWEDMYIPSGGTITYSTVGTAPYRKFSLTFCGVHMYSCTSQWTTCQIDIYETTENIEVYIGHKTVCSGWNGGNAIVGVQNASGSASTVAPGWDYPTTHTVHDVAWRFTPDDTTISSYSVASIAFTPVPFDTVIRWYDSTTGAFIDTGTHIFFTPSAGDSTVYATAIGCDDTSVTVYHVSLPALGGGHSPVHITSFGSTNPSVCGFSNGTIYLTGINPGVTDTVFYSYEGVEQPNIIAVAGTDSILTFTGLCAGIYDYFYVKEGPCPSNTVGPITLSNPSVVITDTSHTNASCSTCDGTFTLYGLPPGQSVTVNYNYNGSPQAPVTITSTAAGTVTLTNLCAGSYDNIVANLNACSTGTCASAPFSAINVLPPPLIEVRLVGSTNESECGACDGTITITGMAPGSVDTVYYSMNGIAQTPVVYSANPDSSITLYSLCAGSYSDFFIKVAACPTNTITSVVTLTQPPLIPSFTDATHYGCNGDTIIFSNGSSTAAGPLYYIWHFGDGTTDTLTNPHHIYAQGNYNVTLIVTNHHCVDSVSGSLSLVHPIQAIFSTSVNEVCQGTPVAFTNSSIGVPPTYAWSFGDGNSDTASNPSHAYQNVGAYNVQLIATNFIPCSDTATTVIKVDSLTKMSLAITDTVLCAGTYVTLTSTYTNIGNTGITWNFGDGDSIKNKNPVSYAFVTPGTYNVTATATYNVCPTATVSGSVNVFAEPSIYLGSDTSICLGGETGIILSDNINAANPAATWLWSTGETTSSIGVNVAGCYYATVNIHGCAAADTICVTNSCYLSVPNVFTPNGDGVNDYFCPRDALAAGLTVFKMDIYDRWGELIFETTAIDGKGWDGKFNEIDQPQGVYIYLISATFKDGSTEHYKGNFTLLR